MNPVEEPLLVLRQSLFRNPLHWLRGVIVIILAESLRRRARKNRGSYRFYRDHVAIETHVKKSVYAFHVDYQSVGHVELADDGVIRLDRAGAVGEQGAVIDVARGLAIQRPSRKRSGSRCGDQPWHTAH
jgi:hypothetical protein